MKKLLIFTTLIGCGADPASQPQQQPVYTTTQPAIERTGEKPPKEVVVEHRKINGEYALAVTDTADLPECTIGNDRQLAYVKNQDLFFNCEDEVWTEIDLRGEVGPKGDPGPAGEPAKPIPLNQWYDPLTDTYWLIGALISESALDFYGACEEDDWDLPTQDELRDAITHGLVLAATDLGAGTSFWTTSLFDGDPAYRIALNSSGNDTADGGGGPRSHTVVCMEVMVSE